MGMMLPEGMPPPGMGAPPMGPPPMGPPSGPPPDAYGQEPSLGQPAASDEDRIRAIMDEYRAILGADGLDENEKLLLEKVNTINQQILAGREKQNNALIGGGPATQALQRAYQG